MRIVILGAGDLGYSIAELLSNEDHDVIVVDNDEDSLNLVKNTLDVLTIESDASSPSTLRDNDISSADILVATTRYDEVNIIACILAKKVGISHTIARIRDSKYINETDEFMRENFDIDLAISPEQVTAYEMNRILMAPLSLNIEDFANGKVRLFETNIPMKSHFANMSLKDLNLPDTILAAMIFRDHEMIIPHGNDIIRPFDSVYFIGDPKEIEKFSHSFVPMDTGKVHRVIVIGAGRTGLALAPLLEKNGVSVKLIDNNENRCKDAAEILDNSAVICGDATDIDLLMEEGVSDADAVICTTGDDRLNMMMALISKHAGAKKTVVRVAQSDYVNLMEKIGVDVVLSTRLIAAEEVLAFIRKGGLVSVSFLEDAKVEALELILQEGSPVSDKPLMDIDMPKECLIGAYVRDGEAFIPKGKTVLKTGDRVIIITKSSDASNIMDFLKGNES